MFVLVDTDLTTHEAKELASALEQNKSLEFVNIDTVSDDGIRILRQVLNNHPTVKSFVLPNTESDYSSSPTSSDDDDLQLVIAMSLSIAEEEQKRMKEEEELWQVLNLSLVDH